MASQKEIVDAVAQALQTKDLSQQAVGIIHRASEKVLKRVQQDMTAGIKENADEVTEDFCKNLASKLGNMSQTWYDNNKQELMIYPEGTRFIRKDGTTTVIVVEQPPQVRTVVIDGDRYRLAMPYTVFITGFIGGSWAGTFYAGFRNTPMTSVNDALSCIPLPNFSKHNVCMGEFQPRSSQNMTEQVNALVGEFWQSRFEGGASGLETWAAKTRKDPLFVLHEKYHPGDTVNSVVNSFASTNAKQVDIVNALKQEIVTAVGTIGSSIQNTMLNVDLVKQNKQKVSIETLDEILKEIIVQAYSELWEYLQAQLQKERVKMQQEMVNILKTRGVGDLTSHKW